MTNPSNLRKLVALLELQQKIEEIVRGTSFPISLNIEIHVHGDIVGHKEIKQLIDYGNTIKTSINS